MIWLRELKILWQKALYNDHQKSVFQKWKQSLLAITFALLLTSFLILIKGENPIFILSAIFQGATRNVESFNETLIYYAMFMLAGLAIIIAFRSGLFNIGVGGQMLISGTVMIILAVKTSLPWLALIMIGMFTGSFAAAFSGFLKAYFNIHEVVSSILINWIFFYISQYLLDPTQTWTDDFGQTLAINNQARMQIGESIVMPALIVTSFLLISAIIIFKTTKWGYALEAVGQNPDASRYAGIKVGWQIIFGMALSGFVAGALASVNYLGKFGAMSQSVGTSLPAIGFQGISVALIAFKSFFGLIPAAFFWAIITSGANYVSIIYPNIPPEVLTLMNGFIIYMIAISIVFIRFKLFWMLWLLYLKLTSPEIKKERAKLKVAKQAQKRLFLTHQAKIQALDQTNERATLKTLISKKQKLQIAIKKSEQAFRKANKKPLLITSFFASGKTMKERLSLANYHKALASYWQNQYQHTISAYQEYENLITKIKVLNDSLSKALIAKNKAQYQNGLAIIQNEFKYRENIIYQTKTNASIFGKWKQNYLINKNHARFFEEKYNLLKLELQTNLKSARNAKAKKDLKQAFIFAIDKLKTKKIKKERRN